MKNNNLRMYRVTNPFSGETAILNQTQVDMYVEIVNLEHTINSHTDWTGNNKERNKQIDRFDSLRHKFRSNWPNLWYTLLD